MSTENKDVQNQGTDNQTTTYSKEDYEALEQQLEAMKGDYAKLKNSFDKTASELSEKKKKEKDNMDANERTALEIQELTQKNEKLEAEIRKANFLKDMSETGLDAKEVEAMFTAFNSGDGTALAKAFSKAVEQKTGSLTKELETLKLEGTKITDKAMGGNAITPEAFAKMTLDERSALRVSQPEVYAKLRELRGGN